MEADNTTTLFFPSPLQVQDPRHQGSDRGHRRRLLTSGHAPRLGPESIQGGELHLLTMEAPSEPGVELLTKGPAEKELSRLNNNPVFKSPEPRLGSGFWVWGWGGPGGWSPGAENPSEPRRTPQNPAEPSRQAHHSDPASCSSSSSSGG